MIKLKIIGVGSPFGDDNIAQLIIKKLQQNTATNQMVDIIYTDRPGVRLLEMLSNSDCVILIDAIVSNQTPGQIIQLENKDIESLSNTLSSHGIGLAETLSLGRSLNALPDKLLFYGIEIDPNARSPKVTASAEQLANQIRKKMVEILS